ncbi:MAG: bifunctional oligoribonuclease/PAP phosphatase NrnA [Acidobacteria bacterium]|nr:MAG: bifunctional oligoribonuclease/PAP phosphatase NrnA [Acidobacteriota bacterium]
MDEIIHFIHQHQNFAITSHSRPDGDSLGSELALAAALTQLGKKAKIVNADPYPPAYSGLPGVEEVQRGNRLRGNYDAVFVLETSDLARTGLTGLEQHFIINIDHHRNTLPFGALNYVDDKAAAVGEVIFELIKRLGVNVTPEIATNLYVAVMTDTGSFQFSNTTANTFGVAQQLVLAGAQPAEIAQAVYMSHPESKIRLMARVLDTLEIHPSHKIAWVLLTQDMLRETGANSTATEGLVNYPLSLEGVQAVAFFREEGKNRYRVSLRSKNNYDVAAAAEFFGGGGHTNAAGLWVEGTFEEVREKVISQVVQALEEED